MQCHFNGTLLISMLPPLLVTEFILGVLGNGLALWIFCFHLKPWKSSTVLLFNLAVADFLLNMALPFRASYYKSGISWKFGDTFCNICLFMLAMNRSGSAFFLMAIAVDRYMRVVHPHHLINSLSVSKAAFGALALWLITISMTAHIFRLSHTNSTCESFSVSVNITDSQSQSQSQSLSWHNFEFLFSFYVPLFVILYCTVNIISHLKGRQLAQQAKIKKALFFITVVVVLFSICYFPSNITHLVIWIKMQSTKDCTEREELNTAFFITITLTYLNSVLDPVVYYFSSSVFKNFCRKALHLAQGSTAESTEKKTRETGSQSISQL
nr:hydroxycarboxylic acid receptor 2-like [Monopterus albus]